MRRLLLVKTSSLGDVVHNFPVATDLRAHFPELEIDWAVEASLADLPAMHPAISQVIRVDPRGWRRRILSAQTWREIKHVRALLRRRQYDAVLDTQGLIKSALITRLAPGVRYGLDWASAREPLRPFYDRTFSVSWRVHAVERNRSLAAQALEYRCDSPARYGIAPPISAAMPVALTTPYVVLLHGSSAQAKLWPEHQWVKLGDYVQHRGFSVVLIWGSEEERRRSERIGRLLDQSVIAPRSSLAVLASVLAGAASVFGVDTGLTHLAVALARPTVGIYCATDPEATGLYGSKQALNVGAPGKPPSVSAVIAGWNQVMA
jgi:heptosyltransferase-1